MTLFSKLSVLNRIHAFGFIAANGHRPDVYARKIDKDLPEAKGQQLYFLATESEVLIICIDIKSQQFSNFF